MPICVGGLCTYPDEEDVADPLRPLDIAHRHIDEDARPGGVAGGELDHQVITHPGVGVHGHRELSCLAEVLYGGTSHLTRVVLLDEGRGQQCFCNSGHRIYQWLLSFQFCIHKCRYIHV